ncbi:MAG: hypothetical protein V4673_18125 [Pseudomonadota bacterium]
MTISDCMLSVLTTMSAKRGWTPRRIASKGCVTAWSFNHVAIAFFATAAATVQRLIVRFAITKKRRWVSSGARVSHQSRVAIRTSCPR